MFQKCPICNGTGIVSKSEPEYFSNCEKCPVCNGKRLIDGVTGQPPLDEDSSKNPGTLLLS